jgi:hypothetical protein
MATIVYVSPAGSNSNNGSQSSPFRTIVAASAVAQPGTTIMVAPGTYAGGFKTTASGTAAAPINYISQVPYGATIVGAGTAQNPNQAGWENEGNYVNIRGFDVNGSGSLATSWAFGLYNGASNVTFQGNRVHDIMTDPTAYAKLTSAGNGGAGIMMDSYYGGANSNVVGNLVYNVGPPGVSSNLVHGIYQTQPGIVIVNVVSRVVGDGITSWHNATNMKFINNTVYNVGSSGILVGSNAAGKGNNCVVNNNIVVNAANGIYEEGTTGTNNSYTNNLLYNISGTRVHLQNGLTAKGTIYADPMFVNAASRNFQLLAGSPAINAGTSANAPETDFLGNKIPLDGAYDLGAYEYTGQITTPSPTPTVTPGPTTTPTPTMTPTPTPTHTSIRHRKWWWFW